MKRTKLAIVALTGVLTAAFAAPAFAMLGPSGNGNEGGNSNGTHNQAQNHQCCTGTVYEVLGVKFVTESDQIRQRARDGSGCGGEPGPNQNPEPGWGPPE
jgi:hypothetical protein